MVKQQKFDLSRGGPVRERAQQTEHPHADVIAWLRRFDAYAPWSVPEIVAAIILIAAFLVSL